MRLLRISLLSAMLAGASVTTGLLVPTDAQASVSIAVGFDALVKDADAVSIVTPVESKSAWEEGRIYTYTRVKVEQAVAGELTAGSEGWVRTMGGVVGKIGQLVDGEAVLTTGKSSLLFMRKFKQGTWEVSARAQGQFPVVVDDAHLASNANARKLVKSHAVGVLFPPKAPVVMPGPVQAPGTVMPQSTGAGAAAAATPPRLAGDVLHERSLDEATQEIATSWKRLHPAAATDTKK